MYTCIYVGIYIYIYIYIRSGTFSEAAFLGNMDHHMVDQTWLLNLVGEASSTALWGLWQNIDHIDLRGTLKINRQPDSGNC